MNINDLSRPGRLLRSWLGAPKRKSPPPSVVLRIEDLEKREMMATSVFQPADIAAAFNAGEKAVYDRGALTAQDTFGLDLPLVRETIADVTKIQDKLRQPFAARLDGQGDLAAQLRQAGLTVEYLG